LINDYAMRFSEPVYANMTFDIIIISPKELL